MKSMLVLVVILMKVEMRSILMMMEMKSILMMRLMLMRTEMKLTGIAPAAFAILGEP